MPIRHLSLILILLFCACGSSKGTDPADGGTPDVPTDNGVDITDAGSCSYGGQNYAVGDSFPSDDGCNTCFCHEGGTVSCTLIDCPAPDVMDVSDSPDGDLSDEGTDQGPGVDAEPDTDATTDAGTDFGPQLDVSDPNGDADGDNIPNGEDNCPSVYNPEQYDCDNNDVGDACEDNAFPDTDEDGLGDPCDDDDDNDGLDDIEEMQFGVDCSITDPHLADTDSDGVSDSEDAYPNDPYPAFLTQENTNGTITVTLSNGQGEFLTPFEVGNDLGALCAPMDGNCDACNPGEYCSMGSCIPEDISLCETACETGTVCRQRRYYAILIADFNADGGMDFIAHSYPPEPELGTCTGTDTSCTSNEDCSGVETCEGYKATSYQVWYFKRLTVSGNFPQQYLGTVEYPISGILGDVNNDYRFDVVAFRFTKVNNRLATCTGTTYLGNYIDFTTTCAAGTAAENCAFTIVDDSLDINDIIANEWGAPRAREALDLNDDGYNDIVFGVYPDGGNSTTDVYVVPSLADGTFGVPSLLFQHNVNQDQSPTNSILFADFDNDEDGTGDVLMGLDDDGDAGGAWLYLGSTEEQTDPGTNTFAVFSGDSTKAFDINPNCNTGCGESVGHSSSAKTFDFNFDGSMDVLLGYNYTGPWTVPSKLVIFFGEGDGTFGLETQIGPNWSGTQGNSFQVPQRICPWYP